MIGTRAAVVLAVLGIVPAAGCGALRGTPKPRSAVARPAPPPPAPAPGPPARPLIGVTEDQAALLGPTAAPLPASLLEARQAMAALHPAAVRVLVDWERLQPGADRPADLSVPQPGCARTVGPCAPYAGLRDELRALAATRTPAVIQLLGLPPWAPARDRAGCRSADGPLLSPVGLAAYRALVEQVVVAARLAGAPLAALSPWNEPNSVVFLSPQRAGCSDGGAPRSPALYAQLARAAGLALAAEHSPAALLLGELAGYGRSSPRTLSVSEWVAALPADALCLSRDWSVHGYAPGGAGAVAALEQALRTRGGCAARARIWVTETGAGAPRAGRPRPAGEAEARASCRAMASELRALATDPEVVAVLQYSVREDPVFPVGLLSADLSRRWPAYWLWRAWGQRPPGAPVPALPAQCAS